MTRTALHRALVTSPKDKGSAEVTDDPDNIVETGIDLYEELR